MTVREGRPVDGFADQIVALLPRLRRFGAALTGSVDAGDDVVQAACERALRARAQFEPGTRLDSWMFRIMRNLWIDQRRAQGRAGSAITEPEVLEMVAGDDGRRVTEGRLTLDAVREAMAGLPADQREVLAAVCIEGLSYAEVAAMLGLPLGTVMSRLHRARRSLGARLGLAGAALGGEG